MNDLTFHILALILALFVPTLLKSALQQGSKWILTRKRKARYNAIYGINPRSHRRAVHQTASERIQALAWSLSLNRERVEEGVREYCALIGVDNSHAGLNTFTIRKTIVAYNKLFYKIRKDSRFNVGTIRRSIDRLRVKMRSLAIIRPQMLKVMLMKFLHNTGGMKNHEDNQNDPSY